MMKKFDLIGQEDLARRLEAAEKAYEKFMDAIFPYDWREDPDSAGTPKRVAKMFLTELNAGFLDKDATGSVSFNPKQFENTTGFSGMVFQGNIDVRSMCAHHHMPFHGYCHIAYLPKKQTDIIGLSKLNRAVEMFARRPQTQEHLTQQIHDYINDAIPDNNGVAVSIEANHLCVSHRGIKQKSVMKTAKVSKMFFDNSVGSKDEFMSYVADCRHDR